MREMPLGYDADAGDGLDAALDARRAIARAEAAQFDALLRHLDQWDDTPSDPGGAEATKAADGERQWQYGGSGTPEVPEFALCEIAATSGMSPNGTAILIGEILDLRYRLPALYDALHEGVVDAWRVRKVASATKEFTIAQAAEADRRLSAETLGGGTPMLCRVTMSRLRQILDQVRITTRPKDTDDETERNLDDRDLTIRPVDSGIAVINGTLCLEDGHRLDQRIAQIVGWLRELGDERPRRVLRSVAIGWLAEPNSLGLLYEHVTRARTGHDNDPAESEITDDKPSADSGLPNSFCRTRSRLPRTTVYLHCDRTSDTWSMDGVGPITRAEARDIVGHSNVTLKPVIDLAQNLAYTGYVAPPNLKEQTALMNAGLWTFPSCTRSAWSSDYDHLVDYRDGGPTDSRNGHRLCRYHHRATTFTDWTVRSPAPGVWLWATPAGRAYLVTAGTTTRLGVRQHRERRPRAA